MNDGDAEFEDDEALARKNSKHATKTKNLIRDSTPKLEDAIESPLQNAVDRGNHTFWKLRYSKSILSSATNVACFAQSHGQISVPTRVIFRNNKLLRYEILSTNGLKCQYTFQS